MFLCKLNNYIKNPSPFRFSFKNAFYFSNTTSLIRNSSRRVFEQDDLKFLQQKLNLINTDLKFLLESYKKKKNSLTLNEIITLFYTINSKTKSNTTQVDLNLKYKIEEIIENISRHFKESTEEYPMLGSLIISLKDMKIHNDNLILSSSDLITAERFRISCDEILRILKSFDYIKNSLEENVFNETIRKLEHLFVEEFEYYVLNLDEIHSILNFYFKSYHRDSILLAHFEKQVVKYIENVIEKNLFEKDSLLKLIDVIYYFKILDYDSLTINLKFNQLMVEYVKSNEISTLESKRFCRFISILDGIRQKGFELDERYLPFLEKNFKLLEQSSFKDIEILYVYLNTFGIATEEDLKNKLESLLLSISKVADEDIDSVVSFLKTILFLEKNLSKQEYIQIDKLLSECLFEIKPQNSLKFFKLIYEESLTPFFITTFEQYPEYIVKNVHSFNFEEMCYFYYIFGRHGYLRRGEDVMKQNLDILRDYILLWYGSIRRDRLEITSNYYKILEVVDINDFLMKGSWQ